MDFVSILTFCGALFIFMASPGPGTFAVIARSLGSGFSHGFAMTLGIALGDLSFLLMAIFGLSAIAHLLGDIFVLVKYVGGIYLIYLGIKIFRSNPSKTNVKSSKSVSFVSDFISGFLICFSNPKVILFYLGFLPTFIELSTLRVTDILLISTLVVVILVIVLGLYAYFASKARETVKKPKTQTFMNRFAGSVMIAAGSALIAKQ